MSSPNSKQSNFAPAAYASIFPDYWYETEMQGKHSHNAVRCKSMLHLASARVFIHESRGAPAAGFVCLLEDDTWCGSDISGGRLSLREAYLHPSHSHRTE
jgi:hypothetical protein